MYAAASVVIQIPRTFPQFEGSPAARGSLDVSAQRYRQDDRGIDRQDVVLMLIVAVFALVLVIAALWIGLR